MVESFPTFLKQNWIRLITKKVVEIDSSTLQTDSKLEARAKERTKRILLSMKVCYIFLQNFRILQNKKQRWLIILNVSKNYISLEKGI